MQISELESYAKTNKVPIILSDSCCFLENHIINNKVKKILEIGTAIGYSAIRMALIRKDIEIITIEKDKERFNEAIKNIEKMHLENQITVLLKDALECSVDEDFDLIFIDGAKSKYISFFKKFANNLKKDGCIITDNLSFHGMVEDISKTKNRNTRQLIKKIRKYIEYLKKNSEYNTVFYNIGDGLAVSTKKKY